MKTEQKQTLYIGDCIELLDTYPDGYFDLCLTDPPYNAGLDYGELVDDNRSDYMEWCKTWFDLAMKKCGSIIFTPGYKNLEMWLTEIRYPKGIAIWYCSNTCSSSNLGGFNHYDPLLVYGKVCLGKNVFVKSVARQSDVGAHPCPKPTDLYVDILRSCKTTPTRVLDIFAGSGTTLAACRELGIEAAGFEINPDYESIISTRCKANTPTITSYCGGL